MFVGLRVIFWHHTCEYHFVRISIGCLSLTPTCLFERTKLGLSSSIVHNCLRSLRGVGILHVVKLKGRVIILPFMVKELTQSCSFPKIILNIFFSIKEFQGSEIFWKKCPIRSRIDWIIALWFEGSLHLLPRVRKIKLPILMFFLLKHHSKPNLTSSWHPQVTLIGRGANRSFTIHTIGFEPRTFCDPRVLEGAVPVSHDSRGSVEGP